MRREGSSRRLEHGTAGAYFWASLSEGLALGYGLRYLKGRRTERWVLFAVVDEFVAVEA